MKKSLPIGSRHVRKANSHRLLLALVSLVLVLAACYPQVTTPATEADTLPACPSTIDIREFAFDPAACQLETGTTVTFVNRDSAPHTATSGPGSPAAFDTGTLSEGESGTVTFDTPGEYRYACDIHPAMEGRIVVTDAAGASGVNEQDAAENGSDTWGGGSGY